MAGCHNDTLKSKISSLYLRVFSCGVCEGGGSVVLQKEGADTTFLLVSMKIYLG